MNDKPISPGCFFFFVVVGLVAFFLLARQAGLDRQAKDERIREDGRNAARHHLPATCCPYGGSYSGDEHYYWMNGWTEEMLKEGK